MMNSLTKREVDINGKTTLSLVQFTRADKEHMLAINKHLGVQAFPEKYINNIIDGYNDGDELIPVFHKDGTADIVVLGDWLYVKNGEVYSVGTYGHLVDLVINILEENKRND